ncbi:hypothetical protein GALL_540140 [mine drainage metagenome]|uniref:Uncharacterized protein n=1 Tax=mine drainage metagenome TaxID=410659 RepID=A0A1J5PAD8_9ZZZZ
MRFDHSAVQPQKHAAVDPARVDALLQPAQRGQRQQRGHPREGRRRKGLFHEVADQLGRAFTGFQRDIAGEAIRHNHIDPV